MSKSFTDNDWRSRIFIDRQARYKQCESIERLLYNLISDIGFQAESVSQFKQMQDIVSDVADVLQGKTRLFVKEAEPTPEEYLTQLLKEQN